MNKVLCVLANMFPYGTGEAYMESEAPHYGAFDEVFLCALMLRPEAAKTCREVPENIRVVPVHFARRIVYAIWAIAVLGDRNFYAEMKKLIVRRRLNLKRFVRALVFFSRAHYEAHVICKSIGGALKNKDVVFYSYRFEYQPYVAVLVRKRLKLANAPIAARAHRYDLYEERNPDGYIPLREGLLKELTFVYPCSAHGARYLREKFPVFAAKIETKYLGTLDLGVQTAEENHVFTVASCSTVAPVKRMDKIVETVAHIKKAPLLWIHFGDGADMPRLKEDIRRLPPDVRVELRGAVDNKTLLSEYQKGYYDLFLNLSDSEGLPVSIMEAMSFGVPCVATDVGGTAELVRDGVNGLLIDPAEEPARIAERIDRSLPLLDDLRENARASWAQAFDANKNYAAFVAGLRALSR